MEPHRNIYNNRKMHIEFNVFPKAIGTMFLCAYVVQKDSKFNKPDSYKK